MTDKLIPHNLGAVSTVFADLPNDAADELGAGITSGFGVVSFRGKVWRIKHRGDERNLMREDGDGPRASIEVAIVKASPHLSKVFYEKGYIEGSTEPPDCWSNNGLTPDIAVNPAKKQNPTCATCKQNAWGAKITAAGKASKACADTKRIAVTPLNDLENEVYGGPMLLRVPPASLSDMKTFNEKMKALGYAYFTIGTRIGFDVSSEYPKLSFSAIRVLTDDEAAIIKELRDDPRTARVINEVEHEVAATPAEQLTQAFEQPPKEEPKAAVQEPAKEQPKATAAKATPKATGAKAVPKAEPVKAPPPKETAAVNEGHDPDTGEIVPSSFEDDLDAQLNDLMPGH
jgi:hypothetical protein